MLYMVIERFRDGAAQAVYRRAREQGRMLPDGLKYVDSWVAEDFKHCFQLMEAPEDGAEKLFSEWFEKWSDLVEFELVPVVASAEAARRMVQDGSQD